MIIDDNHKTLGLIGNDDEVPISDESLALLGATVIPAQPGWLLLSFSMNDDPDQRMYFYEEPIIAWAISHGMGVVPITCDGPQVQNNILLQAPGRTDVQQPGIATHESREACWREFKRDRAGKTPAKRDDR